MFATFLHSQPPPHKALTRDLYLLLGPSRPDRIELEKALYQWTETSWFLDQAALADVDAAPGVPRSLPKSWRLGSKPNLRQMHHDACRLVERLVEPKLVEEIRKTKSLTANAQAAGARVHTLPERPRDLDDDQAASGTPCWGRRRPPTSGRPSAEAQVLIESTRARTSRG